MIRIAVCDDEPKFAEQVRGLVQRECGRQGAAAEIAVYTDSGMLYYDIQEKKYFDMLFLDIEMPDLNGMELAGRLKEHLPHALVSFITSHTKYAVKAFELSVFRYIPKTELETCLPLAVSDGLRLLSWKDRECYVVETARKVVKIPVGDIFYIYKDKKYSVLVLENEEVPVRKPLGQIMEELNREEFLLIERGYIVNLFHVKSMEDGEVFLQNGEALPVSRSREKEVKMIIGNFFRRRL